jgi:site-specific DNA-methyltransferase (adenine-specific)
VSHVLHCGDGIAGMAAMPDRSVDVVCTDPPYSEHVHAKQWIGAALTAQGGPRCSTAHASLGFDAITPEVAQAFGVQCARLARRWVIVFADLEWHHRWREWMPLPCVRVCVWDKVDSAPQFTGDRPAASAEVFMLFHADGRKRWNGGGKRNVYRAEVNGERGAKPHPSTKPLALMEQIVSDFTDAGELVADPFSGSGTTGVACKRLGRRFVGWEINEKFHAAAVKRLDAAREQFRLPRMSRPRQLQLEGPEKDDAA